MTPRLASSSTKSEFISTARNDHCPCGSGKKYEVRQEEGQVGGMAWYGVLAVTTN